ncbi:hypothetical protein [Orientia tsutsugamushi]|uniref:Conjugal transfer protein TraI n=1 Tax=Orientia tsutsugamushi TaxID=784 RepID=A0A2U3QP03_ORITS|nr:hypothetical protein [Orientia tsutsugamushi]KJV80675.1 putative conjugative transfer protein TraI [Orientia tsutsugamushi str. UT76]SPR02713.1 conjugal transfer protein TraI [Orientia tsutsugamushi]
MLIQDKKKLEPESVKIANVQNLYERSSQIHGYEIGTSPSAEVEK